MGKGSEISLAKRDDPIFKEGPTFYTRKSDRASTPSTESSPKRPGKGFGRALKGKAQKAPASNPEPRDR